MGAVRVVPHTVYVTKAQKKWLKEHPEFNLSGWLRPRMVKLMESYTFMGEVT